MSSPAGPDPPRRRLGVPTATAIVVASMVGTGVFTTTGLLVRDLGSMLAVLLAWGVGGLIALCGALAYAELVAALPENGGEYQLLSRIYHPGLGFVSGWVSLIVGFSAPTAASAIAFGRYLQAIWPAAPPMLSALTLVAVASLLHTVRVSLGGKVLNAVTLLNVVLIVGFIIGGWVAGEPALLTRGSTRPFAEALASPAFPVGLIYVSFAYSGWNAAAYVAGEIRRPERSLPVSLMLGTGLVTLLYLGLNAVFLMAAPASALSGKVEVGHVAATHLFGSGAARALSALVALGLITTVVALVMTGPRIYEEMGRDYPRLQLLAGRRGAGGPGPAIALQTLVAGVMVLTASFDELLTYMGFTLSLFAGLTVAGVYVLRWKEPELSRPYRTWGYPVTPLVAAGLMLWMIIQAVAQRPIPSLLGIATLLVGLLLYRGMRREPTPNAERQR